MASLPDHTSPTGTRVVITDPGDPRHQGREWLLTNGLGGFAMGTVRGSPARRYHGLLIGATAPPVGRVMALSALHDRWHERRHDDGLDSGSDSSSDSGSDRGPDAASTGHDLTAFGFASDPARRRDPSPASLRSFACTPGLRVQWVYACEGHRITQTLTGHHGVNAVTIEYAVEATGNDRGAGVLEIRPLTPLRGFHDLPSSPVSPDELSVTGDAAHLRIARAGHTLHMETDASRGAVAWHHDPAVWEGVFLASEAERGQDAIDHPASAGVLRWSPGAINTGDRAVLRIRFALDRVPDAVFADACTRETRRLEVLLERTGAGAGVESPDDRRAVERLVIAGDQFVVQRGNADDASRGVSIIAGYPWFSDWGRDTMICLPGLLLCTGRYDEARATLEAFARHQRRGLIPNRFEDRTGEAEYNTVDAALWFVHACTEYLRVSGDERGFRDTLLGPCREVLRWYRDGTDDGIRMDPADALITQGDAHTQLTWMDALREGVAFTPRAGKPVEINALWHHALVRLALIERDDDPGAADEYEALAARVGASFIRGFVRMDGRGCVDRLEPDGHGSWRPVLEIRPNQLFAASLEHSPLNTDQRRAVVGVCREHLLTPRGMRTLSPTDAAYRGRFTGDLMSRDAAYHQGTVWPWLIGGYVEGLLRAEAWSDAAVAQARAALAPLVAELDGPCLNQLYEVYDGDDSNEHPRQPGGCPAQAWSIAEVLRTLLLCVKTRAVVNPL